MYEIDRRPSVVTAASVILYVAAGIVILAGLIAVGSGVLTGGLVGLIWLEIVLAVVTIVLATKILGGSNGARITVIVLQSINIALAIFGGLEGTSIIGIGLNLLVIGLLAWNQDAKAYFRGDRRESIDRGY